MDFRTITENGRHGVRVAAIIIRDGALLTYKVGDQNHLVGGAIKVGESSKDAVAREVGEELGLQCIVKDLMFVVENRFDYNGELHHMIEFHYSVDLLGEIPPHILDGHPYECEWVQMNEISRFDIRPTFLKSELAKWNGAIHHIDIG